jgi:ketosteroid isomerase-like protein
MDPNIATIEQFYRAFQRLDYRAMNNCYTPEIVFFDPVFELLREDEVKYMWEMLCTRARGFELSFGPVEALDHEYYTCAWTASYDFSATGRRVVNRAKAHMRMHNGAIVEHSDAFSLHQWSIQALGWKGRFFGWNRFFQRGIRNKARRGLLAFIRQQQPG